MNSEDYIEDYMVASGSADGPSTRTRAALARDESKEEARVPPDVEPSVENKDNSIDAESMLRSFMAFLNARERQPRRALTLVEKLEKFGKHSLAKLDPSNKKGYGQIRTQIAMVENITKEWGIDKDHRDFFQFFLKSLDDKLHRSLYAEMERKGSLLKKEQNLSWGNSRMNSKLQT